MKNLKLCLAILVPVVALACRREDAAVVEDPAMTEPPPVTAPADTVPMQHGATMNVALAPVGGSNVTGEALFMEHGNQTMVDLTLQGAPGAGEHAAHVHEGTCDQPGRVVAPLDPVTTDEQGTGRSATTVNLPFNQVFDGNHIVAAHVAGGDPGPPVTCGAIPAHTM